MYVYCVSLCSGQHSYTVYCRLILTSSIAQLLIQVRYLCYVTDLYK